MASLTYPISHTSNEIIFARKSDGCMIALFVVGGSTIALFAFFLPNGSTGDYSWVIVKSLLFLFGVAFAAGSFILPMIQNEFTPNSVTLNHSNKTVTVEMINGERAFIPNHEIEGFDMIKEKKSPSASNSAGIHYIHYHVILKRKNGGTWFLTSTTNQQEAEKVMNLLHASLSKEDAPVLLQRTKLPSMFKVEGENPTVVHWTNPTPTWVIAGLRLASVATVAVLIKILLDFADSSWTSSVIFIFLFSLFLTPFLLLINKVKRQSKIRYSLSIVAENLEYAEMDTSNGKETCQKTARLSSIAQIIYSYSGMDKAQNSTLSIHLHSPESEGMAKPPVHLFVSGLNPVECLQLEGWLRDLISSKRLS